MNANKGVVLVVSVLSVSVVFCQAQAPGAALSNPIGPETQLLAPQPEVTEVFAGESDDGTNVIGGKRRLLQDDDAFISGGSGLLGGDGNVDDTEGGPIGQAVFEQAEVPAPEILVVVVQSEGGDDNDRVGGNELGETAVGGDNEGGNGARRWLMKF
ncbi:hypothetical protein Ndes2526B_g02300 [Nannochloris sp. 'desiccata']|nr:hypothetical protein KSW81_003367 [Chlorella desiccata (nom. nud.)]KAH7623004.1 hypothetical protein NADE_007868 [Chlorella desiccata (nom. nud.)]